MSRHKQLTVRVPSKGAVYVNLEGTIGGARIAMWEIWLGLAERHAEHAADCHRGDRTLTAHNQPEDTVVAGGTEFQHAMLAITAAANAIDGLYGSVRRFVGSKPGSGTRQRQILETIKLGFVVGRQANRWLEELDWLFLLRNSIVHHDDDYRPLQVVHESETQLFLAPVDSLRLESDSALRAAVFAREVADTCVRSPKVSTAQWVRGWANWEPGPGETLTSEDIERRTFPIVRIE